MKTVEEAADLLRQQVNAKVIWGASEREVLDWLEERHGIRGEAAEELLTYAQQAKRTAVRKKSLMYLILSIPGVLLPLIFVSLQVMGRFVIVGYGTLLLLILGCISFGVFFRSLFRLFLGKAPGAVD